MDTSRPLPLQISDIMFGPLDLEDAIDLLAILENKKKSDTDHVVAFRDAVSKNPTLRECMPYVCAVVEGTKKVPTKVPASKGFILDLIQAAKLLDQMVDGQFVSHYNNVI